MIRDLDETLRALLEQRAPTGSELAGADVSFDLPDAEWRSALNNLTVNCYLYDVRENRDLRTTEPVKQRHLATGRAIYRPAPVRIDCAYCITAWSPASDESVLDEHRLLGQVLMVLLRHRTIPPALLQGSLATQLPPYPTVVATEGMKSQPEFWGALDQQLKPSLNYVVTLAAMVDDEPTPADMAREVEEVVVAPFHMEELP